MSPEPPSATEKGKGKAGPEHESENWVKKTSKGGNMSLMTAQKRCVQCVLRGGMGLPLSSRMLRSATLASKPRPPRPPKVPPQIQVLNSTAGPSGANRVVIDRVIFQFEEGGSKLTRIGGALPVTYH